LTELPANAESQQRLNRAANTGKRKTVGNLVWRVARIVLIAYLALILIAMFIEELMMFPASRYPEGDWEPSGLVFEDAEFTAADGTPLHGWYVPCDQPRATVLLCHGNAGNVTDRADWVKLLQQELRVSVLVFDYRGYGKSEGRPHEKGIIADGRAARAWLAEREGIDETDIVLLGRSLGGAVAVALAAEKPPRGLVLESTFSSMTDVAANLFPFLPIRLLLRNRFDSLSRIQDYEGPLLVSHSKVDEVIPYKFGKRLYDGAPSKNKRFIEFDDAGHNWSPPEYYAALDEFLDKVSAPGESS
jgi:fermentation-respiration switch protein FrsA (DUF1100 family)